MGQLDISHEDNYTENTSAKGVGWMVGPYAVFRLHEKLYLDGSVTYGRSYNKVNALGLFEDDFQTERFLLQGGITGEFEVSETATINPFARITYYFEKQESYTDTLGRQIPFQDFDLGRLEFGPKVSWDLVSGGDNIVSPYFSVSGIYDFNKLQNSIPSDASLVSADKDFRARLEFGASWAIPDRNIYIAADGFYDGIGVEDFETYGITLSAEILF